MSHGLHPGLSRAEAARADGQTELAARAVPALLKTARAAEAESAARAVPAVLADVAEAAVLAESAASALGVLVLAEVPASMDSTLRQRQARTELTARGLLLALRQTRYPSGLILCSNRGGLSRAGVHKETSHPYPLGPAGEVAAAPPVSLAGIPEFWAVLVDVQEPPVSRAIHLLVVVLVVLPRHPRVQHLARRAAV